MIICVCNELNDRKVADAVDAGARSPDCVQAHHGCAFNCGQCREMIGERIAERVDGAADARTLIAAE